jgi:hypothetical protein
MLNYLLYFPCTVSKLFWYQGCELTLKYVPNHICVWSQISTNCRLRHYRKLFCFELHLWTEFTRQIFGRGPGGGSESMHLVKGKLAPCSIK